MQLEIRRPHSRREAIPIASLPLGATSTDQWVADRLAVSECSATEPVTVDGAGFICVDGALAPGLDRGTWLHDLALYLRG